MRLYEKIKINLKNGKSRQIQIFGIPIIQYDKIKNYKTKCYIPFLQKQIINKEKPIFYLKVNRNIDDTFINLQYWINIATIMEVDFYIICDNQELKLKILEKIIFVDSKIKFIKSKKNFFVKILNFQKIDTKWINAACAHLTVFHHAKENDYNKYWNIDADDALFLTPPQIAVKILSKAAVYADSNNIDLFGFDFWATKTKAKHWSFGITYTQNNIDYFDKLQRYQINWENYKNFTSVHNIDWVFTNLKNIKEINAKTFYVENLYFIHWGSFLGDMGNAYLTTWSKNYMLYPIRLYIFKDKKGIIPIINDPSIIRLNFDIEKESCYDFAIEYLTSTKRESLKYEIEVPYENI